MMRAGQNLAVLGVAFLLGATLSSAAPAVAPQLQLEASPRQLQPGRDATATLLVRGNPEQMKDVRIQCSSGAVRNTRRVSDKEWKSEFVLPRQADLNWVLCAALGSTNAVGSIALEIQKREMLALSGLPPLSRAEVALGSDKYGPVRSNSAGYAEVPVTLTPSVRMAEIVATPPGGAPESHTQRLSPSPTEQVVLVSLVTSTFADGTRGVPFWLFTTNDRGEPQDVPLALSANDGPTPALQRVAPGIRTGTFVPYPHSSTGAATLMARTTANRSIAILRIELEGGVKPKLAIEAPVHGLPADGLATVDLLVKVSNQQGQGLGGLTPKLSTTAGTLSVPDERAPGEFIARFTAPASGDTAASITAEVPGTDPASLTLQLTPPPRLTVEASPRQVPADGQSRVTIQIVARGGDGRLLPDGTALQVSSTLGTVPPKVTVTGGRAKLELVASRTAGDAVVEVFAEGVRDRTTVRLLPGQVKSLVVRPDRPSVRCGGLDSTDIHIFVRDENGNGLDGAPIEVVAQGASEAQRGELGKLQALGGGEFVVRYRSPQMCVDGPLTVSATTGDVNGDARLHLVRSYGALALSAHLGAQHNLGRLASSVLEVEADARTPLVATQLLASASMQLAFGTFDGAGPVGIDSSGRSMMASLYVGPRLNFVESHWLVAFAGLGLDGHLVRVSYPNGLSTGGERVDMGPVLGGHVRAGIGYALGPGLVQLQVRYGFVELAAPELRGQASGLAASVGYRLTF